MNYVTIVGALALIMLLYGSAANVQHCHYSVVGNSVLDCSSVPSLKKLSEQLEHLLSKKLSPNLREIIFSDLGEMPCMPSPNVFHNVQIERFSISNFTLKSWFCPEYDGARTAFHGLQNFDFTRMKGMEKWNWEDVAEYTGYQVESLYVHRSQGTVRLPSTIQSFYGDHVTSISINGIEKLELEDSSLHCPKCDFLHIMETNITNFRKEVFGSGLSQLNALYILGNETENLPKDILQNIVFKGGNSSSIVLGLELHFVKASLKDIIQPLKKSYKEINIHIFKNNQLVKCECSFSWLLDPGMGVTEVACDDRKQNEMKLSIFLKQTDCKKQ